MNLSQSKQQSHRPDDAPELSAINILIALAKYKRRLIAVPLLVAVLVAGITFVLPDVYRANAKLLPPQQQSGTAMLLSQLGGMAALGAGAAGIKSPNDVYIGMLKSRSIADALIKKHSLNKVYQTNSYERLRAKLAEATIISSGKDGLITLEFMDEDRKLVAPLTNSYIDELMKLTRVLAVTEAAQRRLFFERQLEQAKNNLGSAEVALKEALDNRGVISVDGQSRAIVEMVGQLRARISAKQIELNAMNAFVTKTNPDHRRVVEELNSLRAELSQLENGRPDTARRTAAPRGAGLENIKILRDVKYYQMLYELLAKQYEAARLDEARESSVVQVLDYAVEPERKFKPKRALIVVISGALSLLAALAWIFLSEVKQAVLRQPSGAARWEEFVFRLKN